MKRSTHFLILNLFLFSLFYSCTKTAYVTVEPEVLEPVINQTVTYTLNSPNAVMYSIEAGDSSYFVTNSNTFKHTWTEAGTYAVDVTAYPKHGKGKGHHCLLVEVFNDPTIFNGSYFLEGTCDSYTVSVSPNGLSRVKIDNLGGFGFEIDAATTSYQGYGLIINKQAKTTEAGKYLISGHGYLTTTNDRLVVEYVVEYEDFADPDMNYTTFCKMDGLKL